MTSRCVMGVATKILLILTLSFCAEAQMSILLVDVEAKNDVEVFWSLFPVNDSADLTYTVCYAINFADPDNFNCTSTGAVEVDAGSSTSLTLPNIPPSSYVTVVVVANEVLKSNPPVTRQTFDNAVVAGIPAPEEVALERFDNNTILQVTWTAVDSLQLLSYDIQYSLFDRDSPDDFQPIATINSPEPSDLELNITDLDGDTSYQVRVRGVVEIGVITEGELIETQNGIWSKPNVSEVELTTGGSTSSGSISVYAACNGIIFTTFLLAIILFF